MEAESPGWPNSHNSVIRKILAMSKKTPVLYIPGNDDMKELTATRSAA